MYDEQTDGPSTTIDDSPEPMMPLLVAAFLLGLLLALGVVLGYQVLHRSDDQPLEPLTLAETARSGSAHPEGPSGTEGTADPRGTAAPRTRLTRCTEASHGLEDVLADAQPALDQWAIHVGAMNKLVLGELTLQQATAFWDQTRLAARRHVDDFRVAMTDLRRQGVDCPGPALLGPGARALPGCVRHVAAHVRVVGTARTSIETWEHHIHDMELLRTGDLSPEEATAKWLSMWQQGMRDLDAYAAAAKDAERQDTCTPGAAAR